MPKAYKTTSDDRKLAGTMPTMHSQTPTTHATLISSEERRRAIRTINGILKNGIKTPLTTPRV